MQLSDISWDENTIDKAYTTYQKTLDESDYHHRLIYEPTYTNKAKPYRKRDIMRYNPTFVKM